MNLNELLRFKALNFKYVHENQALTDMALEGRLGEIDIPLKNVCAMVTQELFDDLTNVCGLLDISKRLFIEKALIDAIQMAHKVMDDEGVENFLERLAGSQEK